VLAVEAVQRLQAPEPVAGWTVIVVAAIGVLVNGLTAMLFMAGRKSDLNVRGAFLHMAGDALVSLGVVVAGLLYLQFGWGWLDPLVSLAIAVVIVLGTWGLFRQSLHLAFDGVPEGIDLVEVHAWLSAQPGVVDVHDLHVWALGTSDVALTAHLVMPAGHPGDAFVVALADGLAQRFHIHHPTIQIELDGIDDGCARPAGSPRPAARQPERRARKRSSAAPKACRSPALKAAGPPVCTPLPAAPPENCASTGARRCWRPNTSRRAG
jgi:cobalt-zinc-cadmium efflux system protein